MKLNKKLIHAHTTSRYTSTQVDEWRGEDNSKLK